MKKKRIDKRTLPKKKSTVNQISKTKQEQYRKQISKNIKKNAHKEINKKLAISSNRKFKHISFQKYQDLIIQGKTAKDINKITSKHLIYFYNAILKGKINLNQLTKKKFEEMYDKGMSLNEIAKSENIPKGHIAFLREFYGIKRKGATYQRRLKNEKPISQEAKNIIIGSMLGDGHMTDLGYYTEKHSPEQLKYLQWKANFFPHLTTSTSWCNYETIDKRSGTLIKTYSFRTRTHSWFQEIEKLFYKTIKGKRTKIIPDEIIDWMNEEVLAVWFMDDGITHWTYRNGIKKYPNAKPSVSICTDSFSITENKKLIKTIDLKFNIQSYIGGRNRILFNTKNTAKLLPIIKPFCTSDLLYKVDEKTYVAQKLKTKIKN